MRKDLILRHLIRSFFADYLSLLEPEIFGGKPCQGIRFSRKPLGGTGVAAKVEGRKGEMVTVLVRIEPEVLPERELSARVRQSLRHLRVLHGEPVLASVVYLQGGRSGLRLESIVPATAFGLEVGRFYVTTFGLTESWAESYLKRPEPLAWALAAGMRSTHRTEEELRRACLDRIAAEALEEERRVLLRRAVRAFLPRRPTSRAEAVSVREGRGRDRGRSHTRRSELP